VPRANALSHPCALLLYNKVLEALVEQHAPSKCITITERPDTPWYSLEIRHAKTECRRLERRWLRSKLTIDHELFKSQRNHLKSLRETAKRDYIQGKLNEATTPRDTHGILNKLLHKAVEQPLPSFQDPSELAERFATFFTDKISAVRNSLTGLAHSPPYTVEVSEIESPLATFDLAQHDEVAKLVMKSPTKSCALDPVPTWLVKKCPALIPFLCDVINESLKTCTVPVVLKQAHVVPALKKSS